MPVREMEITPRTFVQSSNLFQVNSVVVSGETETLLIDPAWYPDELGVLTKRVAASPVGRATRLVLTHCDGDHVGRVNDFGDLPIIASPAAPGADWAGAASFVNQTDATQIVDREGYFRPPAADRLVAADRLDLGGEVALFFPVAGHTADSLFVVLPAQRLLIAGDYLHDILSPIVRTSITEYRAALMKALELLDQHGIRWFVPGHGRVVDNAAEVRLRAAIDIDYVDRLEAALHQAADQGLTVDETIIQLKDFVYGERGLTPYMQHLHANNIKTLLPRIRPER